MKIRSLCLCALFGIASLAGLWLSLRWSERAVRAERSTPPLKANRWAKNYGQLPLSFEAIPRQSETGARFLARGGGYALWLNADGAVLQLQRASAAHGTEAPAVLQMRLVKAARRTALHGEELLAGRANYFIGADPRAWRTAVPQYSRVRYAQVYPGIDLVWYGQQRQLEHDFIVAPGARPEQIKLDFGGVETLAIESDGALRLDVNGGALRLLKPQAWQLVQGERRAVACTFHLNAARQVEFALGAYDRRAELVIDPVLVYATYLGGTNSDLINGIAVDNAGNAYVTGYTASTDFPGSSPVQATKAASNDVFVLKLNPAGTAVVYATWLGGGANDVGNKIALDGAGNAIIAGSTSSSDFPVKNALQSFKGGSSDAFIAKLNPAGNALAYSTPLGGAGTDQAYGLAADADGNAYVVGTTDSPDFPLQAPLQNTRQGRALYRSANRGGQWLAGSAGLVVQQVNDLAVDPKNVATLYAATDRGVFKSTDSGANWAQVGAAQINFSTVQVAVDAVNTNNVYAVYASALYKSTDGGTTWNRLNASGAIQGVALDPITPTTVYAIAIGSLLRSTDGGATWAPLPSPFPIGGGGTITPVIVAIDALAPMTIYNGTNRGLYKSTNGGGAWQALNVLGLPLNYSVRKLAISPSQPATLLMAPNLGGLFKTADGGTNWTNVSIPNVSATIQALAFDPTDANIVYVATSGAGIYKSPDGGTTWAQSNTGLQSFFVNTLAVPVNTPATVYAGGYVGSDLFVSKLNPAGTALVFSTYLGGSNQEASGELAVDGTGNVYVTGRTQSSDFPKANAYQNTLNGLADAFVTKFNPAGTALIYSTYLGGRGFETCYGIAVNAAGNAFVAGSTDSLDFPTVSAFQNANRSTGLFVNDAFVARLSVDGTKLDYATYLGGGGGDIATAIAVDSASNAYVTGVSDSLDFPVLGALQATRAGDAAFVNADAFVTKLNPNGASLGYSTYLGGVGSEQSQSLAVDGAGAVYVAGYTGSNDFPTTPNAFKRQGFNDGFVAKLAPEADLALRLSDLPDPVQTGGQLTYLLTVTNNGPDAALNVTATDTLPAGLTLVSVNTPQGSCNNVSPLVCNLGTLANKAGATVTILANAPTTTGTLTNQASVTSATPDSQAANNTARQETRISTLPSIYGQVKLANGAGLSGVNLALTGTPRPAVTTDVEGAFQFAELTAGANYTVTPARSGYVFNPANRMFNNLTRDQRGDFTAVQCLFAIAPRTRSFPATGGTGELTITSPDAQCPWIARSNVDWIRLTSATTGTGNATVTFAVAPTVSSRVGTLTVAGHIFTVVQEFYPCTAPEFRLPLRVPLTGSYFDQTFPRVVVADFNRDNRLDAAYLFSFDQKGVAVVLANSQGGFNTPVTLLDNADYQALHAADFNGDGAADLAVTSSALNQVIVFLGGASFSTPKTYATGPQPAWVTSADLNGDGKLDLVVATASTSGQTPSSDQNVSLLFGNDTGGFNAAQNIGVPLPSAQLLNVEAADFTGDGKTDLLLLNMVGEVLLLPGNGNGTFGAGRRTSTQAVFGWLVRGDFNGDGKLDFVAVRRDSTELKVYLNDGAGNFGTLRLTQAFISPSAIAAADFDRDGKTDLALTDPDGFAIYHATVNGNFAPPVRYFSGGVVLPAFGTGSPGPLAIGDFNRDGRTDLFVPVFTSAVNGYPATLALVQATANGFDAPRNFPHTPPDRSYNPGPLSAAAGDLNGDGVLDVAVSALSEVYVSLGNGRGEFSAPKAYFAGQTPESLTLRDFNGDGRLDALALLQASDTMTLLLNNGNGFADPRHLKLGSASRALGVGDFNGDGRLDVVTKSKNGGLGLYVGNGQGDFSETVSRLGQELDDPIFVTGDFNGDGRLDIALTAYGALGCESTRPLLLLAGDGAGGFNKTATINWPADVAYTATADLNADGRDDLLLTSVCPNKRGVYVALGDSANGFTQPVKYDAGTDPRTPSIGDLNGDGKPDLSVTNPNDGSIFGSVVWLTGKGDGTFNAAVPLLVGQTPNVIVPADFNQDGLNDLAVFRRANATFGLLFNSALCLPANTNLTLSAASFTRNKAPRNSIAALFGASLAAETRSATVTPLPTTLANVQVRLTDSSGMQRLAPLFFISPGQINYLIPAETALGQAVVHVLNGAAIVSTGTLQVTALNPGLFTANASGSGLPAAVILRVKPDGQQLYELVARFDTTLQRFVPVPVELSQANDQVILLLFGTGVRGRSSLQHVSVTIGGLPVPPLFAGTQGGLVGVDQINVTLPRELAGRGEVEVLLTADGSVANPVRLRIQ